MQNTTRKNLHAPLHHECTTVHAVKVQTCTTAPHRTTPLKGWCSGAVVQRRGDPIREFQQEGPGREESPKASKTARRANVQKLVAVNEDGLRIGEGHGRARLSDADVALVVGLIEARQELIDGCEERRMPWGEIARLLGVRQLSYGHIALKMEISETHVRDIANGRRRCQVAVRWKRVGERAAEGALGEIAAG